MSLTLSMIGGEPGVIYQHEVQINNESAIVPEVLKMVAFLQKQGYKVVGTKVGKHVQKINSTTYAWEYEYWVITVSFKLVGK